MFVLQKNLKRLAGRLADRGGAGQYPGRGGRGREAGMVRNFSTGNVYGLANLRVSVVMLLTLSQIVEKVSSGILLRAPRETRIHEARVWN